MQTRAYTTNGTQLTDSSCGCRDLLIFNQCKGCVLDEVEQLKKVFDVDNVGPLKDYLGCKLEFDWNAPVCKLTQPVLVQSMKDLHGAHMSKQVKVPATAGTTLPKADPSDPDVVDKRGQKEYRGLVGQLLHMASWSRPEISNAVREVSRHGHCCTMKHPKAAKKIAAYVWQTRKRGWTLHHQGGGMAKQKIFFSKCRGSQTPTTRHVQAQGRASPGMWCT